MLLLAGILYATGSDAQQLATWTAAPTLGSWGAEWAPTTTATNVIVSSFTKGAGIAGSGNPAGGSWGGSGGWSSAPLAGNTNGALYFTVKAAAGYAVSLTSIPTFVTRRSPQGAQNAMVAYSIDGGSSYTAIGTISTTSTSGSGANSAITGLDAIAALQNVPSTTTITIKVVPTNGANNWYIMYSGGGFALNGSVSNAPLPVALRSFTASRSLDKINLSWVTAMEENVSHFELEKSNDAISYAGIGQVQAANSADGADYTYTDQASGKQSYYRLKTVDQDGQYRYSQVVSVTGSGPAVAGVSLLRNPVREQLAFTSQGKTNYTIVALSGQIVQTGTTSADEATATVIDVSRLSKGMYLLRLYSPGDSHTLKFIKE